MGKSTKLTGNPDLARVHEEGAQVVVIQSLVHSEYGTIHYPLVRLWVLHLKSAVEACKKLEILHLRVLEIPLAESNSRTVSDEELLAEIYVCGTAMVSNAISSVQHYSQELESIFGTNNVSRTVAERIKESARRGGVPVASKLPGYDGLTEIADIRNAIEHPQAMNVHQGDPNRWDEVPLAWMLSDRSLRAFDRFIKWFEQLVEEIEKIRSAIPAKTVELTVVRGIESKVPSKKPPAKKGS